MTQKCVLKDDAVWIAEKVKNADTLVFTTPICYYEMSGQMKTLLDRMNPLYPSDYKFRKVYMLSAATEDEEYVPEKAVSGLQGRVDCFEKAEQAALFSAEGFLIPGRHPGRMRNRMRHMNSVKHWSKSNFILASVLALLTFFLSACSTGRAAYSGSSEEAASSEEMIMPETTSSAAVNEHSEAPGSEITGEIPEGVKDSNMQQVQSPETGNFDFTSQTVLLNSGWQMPIIGLGTWTLSDDEAENSVYHALKCGMRLIDTARYYGNEVGVGRGLQKAIDEEIVTREEVFITSKIYGGNYEHAGGIIDDALSDLNVDYIDLMLIHQPGADDKGVYKAMEDAVNDGRLRSIGISNYYTREQVDEVLSFATIVPAVIQNENHLYYQNTELQEYVRQYGIVIESWYPFGGRGHTSESFNNEVILELGEKYQKSSAQIILRWHLQAGFIAIPGSSNPDHIAENYDIFDFELTEEEMQSIRDLDKQERYENW